MLLLACGGSDEPTDAPSSERATAEPTNLPDSDEPTDGPASERATDEPETPAFPARSPSTPGSGVAPTATDATATAPPADSGSVEKDREALVAFYNATTGWASTANWQTDAPLSEWAGVTTNDAGRVVGLKLNINYMSGVISPELANLTQLKDLDLTDND